MKYYASRLLALCLATTLPAHAESKPDGATFFGTQLLPEEGGNTAVQPVGQIEEEATGWSKRHEALVDSNKTAKPEVVLIGDSITEFWGGLPASQFQNGPESWQATFGNLSVLNMGFIWDRTQNVLWRLDHGEFETIRPQVAILNVGMHNLIATEKARANSPEEIADGIVAITKRIQAKSPQTRIVVMGVFPRGDSPDSEWRAPIAALNALLAKSFADKKEILFLDIGPQFLANDGSLLKELMIDDTLPNEKGYALWASALVKAGALANLPLAQAAKPVSTGSAGSRM